MQLLMASRFAPLSVRGPLPSALPCFHPRISNGIRTRDVCDAQPLGLRCVSESTTLLQPTELDWGIVLPTGASQRHVLTLPDPNPKVRVEVEVRVRVRP